MNKIYFVRAQRRNKKNISSLFLFFIILLISIAGITSFFYFSTFQSAKIIPKPSGSSLTPSPQITTNIQLKKTVEDALIGTQGSYGIVIKNLQTGENYTRQKDTVYDSASLYKLWVMAVVYEQIKEGKLKEDDILTQDIAELNKKFEIASESAELTEGTITLSVHKALERMITVSDNYSSLLLTEKVRLSSVAAFLKNNGFIQSSVGVNGKAPTTTPSDIALFFEKLYKNQLMDENYSQQMLSLLKAQKLTNKIPHYLPDTVTIAHKTGELNEYTHDAGIIYTDKGDYIIVIFSKSENADLAANRLANISEAVYNYFGKN